MIDRFKKLGVSYSFFRTHPNRWGEGKVHLRFWSKEHRQWVLLCRPSDVGGFSGHYGEEIDTAEVTCKKCIKKDPR